jgi:hypothetical protein
MPNAEHEEAQELSALAELARRSGQRELARERYLRAAELEKVAFEQLPKDRPRSRGILAVSYAALLFKAAEYDRVEAAICSLLFLVDPPFQDQLRELLQVSWDERQLASQKLQYSDDEILVALRGGEIGMGSAPAEIATRYMNGVHSLAYRAAEFDAGLDLRTKGMPTQPIQNFLQARATQPSAGSYRFSVRFVEPAQADLLSNIRPHPNPQRVSRVVLEVLKAIQGADRTSLEQLVPRPEYRLALTKLGRNLVPGGISLTEVEVRTAEDSPDQAVRLDASHKKRANQAIKEMLPADPGAGSEEQTIDGILRGVSLDRSWLEVRSPDGSAKKIRTGPYELDDVIGPMVNRKVRARIRHVRGSRKAEPRLVDIETLED